MRPLKRRIALLSILFLSPSAFSLCAKAEPLPPSFFQVESETISWESRFWLGLLQTLSGKPQRQGDLTISVKEADGSPLAGVRVLVGQRAGDPFEGNQTLTDAQGLAIFSAPELRTGRIIPITATLPGYTNISLLDNQDNQVRITMQRLPEERSFGFLRGKLPGIPKQGSGNLEMGFFIPAARPESLLNFDIQSFVSSYNVKVNIYGERDIPGNVVLPQQNKHWGIIPISISKPDYVMPLATGLTAHMFGIAGGISITQAANLIQKKDFLELLNLTNLSAVGWTREPITVRGDDTFDIGLNHPVNPNKTFAQISGLGDQQLDAAAVSLLDPVGDRGDFVSMDIKALKKENFQNGVGTIRLGQISSRATQGSFYIFTALFDRSQIQNSSSRWVVGSVKPASSRGVSFHRFLNPMRSLGVSQNNREYRFSNPSGAISADLLLIQIVSEKKNAETSGKTRRVLWSAISRGTGERVQLPDLGIPVLPQPDSSKEEKFHWEITAIKTSASRKERFNLQRALKDLQDVSTLSQAY